MRPLIVAVLVVLQGARGSPGVDRQVQTLPLSPSQTLSLDITVGQVRIEGSDQPGAAITVVRQAPTPAGLDRVPLRVETDATAVRVRAVQLDGATDPAYRTDVTLRVPGAATLNAVTIFEGHLTLADLAGTVTAEVRRGGIDATGLAGTIRLETGIGDITADRMRLSPDGLLRLRAFNGDVRLTLAERPPDARILALALNGSIRSTLPLTMRDTWGPRWGETTLGRGHPIISVDVVTGSIEIRVPQG